MADVVLCLGTNLGDRRLNMRQMEAAIDGILLPPIRMSRLMETEPLGTAANHPWYYNRIVRGRYNGSARELLEHCRAIEKKLGRTRPGKYAPRTADLDILLFDDQVVNEPDLTIPHRRIPDRRFCLEGLQEIAEEWIVPGTGKSANKLIHEMRQEVRMQEIRIVESHIMARSFSKDN